VALFSTQIDDLSPEEAEQLEEELCALIETTETRKTNFFNACDNGECLITIRSNSGETAIIKGCNYVDNNDDEDDEDTDSKSE
jgi:hypothetical protein